MNIEILAIGDEILDGHTINSNAAVISRKLASEGYVTNKHTVIPDCQDKIIQEFQEIFVEKTLLICTGGLGPTEDDTTKKAIASFFDVSFEINNEVLTDMKHRYGDISTLENQSTVIKDAKMILNPEGTAPGMVHFFDRGCVIFLPGVPNELEAMLDQVMLYVEKAYPLSSVPFSKEVSLFNVKESDVEPKIKTLNRKELKVGSYPFLGGVQIRAFSQNEKKLTSYINQIKNIFPNQHFFSDEHKIEQALHNLLISEKKTVAFAESCSGGALAAAMTKHPGSSEYFLGSVISYSNQMKNRILGVSKETLDNFGAVSKETVTEMLQGLFEQTTCDYAVAVSGIAGPTGGTKDKPVGTVYVGVAKRDNPFDIGIIYKKGSRKTIIAYTVNTALSILYRKIAFNKDTFNE